MNPSSLFPYPSSYAKSSIADSILDTFSVNHSSNEAHPTTTLPMNFPTTLLTSLPFTFFFLMYSFFIIDEYYFCPYIPTRVLRFAFCNFVQGLLSLSGRLRFGTASSLGVRENPLGAASGGLGAVCISKRSVPLELILDINKYSV